MAKKDEIIEAALDIICQDGVRSLTLPALFQKARTGAGTFYHYFSGREELIEAVFDVCCAVAVDELTSFKQLEGSAESRFGALCQMLFRAYRVHPREMLFLYLYGYGYVRRLDKSEGTRSIPSIPVIAETISQGQQEGSLSPHADPLVCARAIRSSLASVYWSHRCGLCEIDDEAAAGFACGCWRALSC